MLISVKPRSEGYDPRDQKALASMGIMDALVGDSEAFRTDGTDDASVFFSRELDFIKANSYDRKYPRLTAVSLFPVSSEAGEWAKEITFHGFDQTGIAKIITDYADDLPRADVIGQETTAKVRNIGDSFGYSIEEMRGSIHAGKSLDVRKAEAARQAIERKINEIAWAGDESHGLQGVLSPSNNVPLYTIPAGASGSTKWADKTPDEILADITGMLAQIDTTTNSVEQPDTLCLPSDAYLKLANTKISDISGTTLLKWLLDNQTAVKNIVKAPELNAGNAKTNPYGAADGTGNGVAFLFENNAEKFTIENPLPFIQHPPQAKGLGFEVPCEAKTAGAIIYYPLSMLIGVGV